MHIYTIDFETYYAKDYTLSKMSTEDYVNDPRFQVILVGIKKDDAPAYYVPGHDIAAVRAHLQQLDLPNNALLCHNTAFDGLILQVHFDITPKLYLDTRLIGRALTLPFIKSVSLKYMADAYSIGQKGTEIHNAIGKLLAHFTQDELERYAGYCMQDCNLTYALWVLLKDSMPQRELAIIDRVLRMYLDPIFILNQDVLEEHLVDVINKKESLMEVVEALGYEKKDLMSNQKFAAVLEKLGAEPPMKISPTTGKETFAFAKTDPGFKELMEHPDERIQALCAARIGHKSTLEETRTARFIDIARKYKRLRVPLLYSAARTHRLGGVEGLNMQNLPSRGDTSLRKAMEAPPGYKILVADQAQIEARLLAHLADQYDILQQFAEGQDVYANFASKVYGFAVNAKDNKKERFVGKVGILSLGYGAGHKKFQFMLQSYGQHVPLDECKKVVDTYRSSHRNITFFWSKADQILRAMQSGSQIMFADCIQTDLHKLLMPNGMHLNYHNLRYADTDDDNNAFGGTFIYDHGGRKFYIYGAKLVENIVQALARNIVMDQLVAVSKYYKVAHTCHDEIVCVVPDAEVEPASAYITAVMKQPPDWARRLPLDVEVGVGQNYSDAK